MNTINFSISPKEWEGYDFSHLERKIANFQSEDIIKELALENKLLWKEKLIQEDIILKDPFNLEANSKAFLYEISIYRRICIIKSVKKQKKAKVPELSQMEPYITEMIKPVTEDTVKKMNVKKTVYGSGCKEEDASPPGKMNCILVREHDEVLFHLLYGKQINLIKNKKILLHFDAHSDMGKMDKRDLEEIIKIKDIKMLKTYFSSLYYTQKEPPNLRAPITLASFLHYGVKKELIKEIFWIIPDPLYAKYRLPANLERYYTLNIEDGKNFRLNNGFITCSWEGINVHILRISDLPEFSEDLIVDIDMDYFLNLEECSDIYGCRGYKILDNRDIEYWNNVADVELEIGDVRPWIRTEEFIQILKEKKINSILTFLSLSPHFTHRYYHNMINILANKLGKPLNKICTK